MRISYIGKVIKVDIEGRRLSIIPKKDFKRLIVEPSVSRKEARIRYKIGSKLYNNSLNYHYGKDEIEKHRVAKIRQRNRDGRLEQWSSSLDELDKMIPGIKKIFEENLKSNPEVIQDKLIELNSLFYEIKDFIRTTKKYIRQAVNRKGLKNKKMVSNLSEYKVYKVLVSMGYQVENQFYIKPYYYDFKVGDTLIEYDGQYHTPERDEKKNMKAIKHGYAVLRIHKSEINDLERLKKKLKREIRCSNNQKYTQ